MKKVDWSYVPTGESMVLLTAPSVEEGIELFMADFKDTMALKFTPTENYLGLTLKRGVRLGKGPKFMRNGIWYVYEDYESQKKFSNFEIDVSQISLENI